jgi:hypothetical protein
MKIRTKVTFKQYVKLLYRLTYSKPIMKLLICFAVLLLSWIILYYLNILNLRKPIIYQYLTLALIVVVQPIVIYTTIRRNYNSSNHLRETLDIELTQREIKIEGESFYMEILWHKMFKIVERSNWFLIYQNNLSAIIIPKKDLAESDIDHLRKIFKSIPNVPIELKD